MEGLNTYNGRREATNIIENSLNSLFSSDEVEIVKFGMETIVDGHDDVRDYLTRRIDVNNKPSSMIVKFAPDYILLKKSEPQELYFLEIKASFTPCWSENRVNKIIERHGDGLNESNIGEIAREALLSYTRYYPNTIVLYGTSYNPRVLMAQFAEEIECLYCYKSIGEYDCDNCPSREGNFFELERNVLSNGSGTPNTNVNLDSFLEAREFFERIGIQLQTDTETQIINAIKERNIKLESVHLDFNREREIRERLYNCGCDWVNRVIQYYSCMNNDFYHNDRNCFTIRDIRDNDLIGYYSENAARIAGKRKCRYCNQEIN